MGEPGGRGAGEQAGKASLILLNIRCSGFKEMGDLVNRVEGPGLPGRRDSGVKACLQTCAFHGSLDQLTPLVRLSATLRALLSGLQVGHALWGEAAVVGGRAEAGELGCPGFQLTHLFGS